MKIEVHSHRKLKCPCGAELPDPPPAACPQCGAKIAGVRRKANWIGAVVILVLFAGLCAALLWLVGVI